MRKISSSTSESIGTIIWMIMDFIWMCEFPIIASIIIPIPLFLFIYACIFYNKKKKSNLLMIYATMCWFLMNSCWILNESTSINFLKILANIFFVLSLLSIFLSYRKSKRENSSILFQRIK